MADETLKPAKDCFPVLESDERKAEEVEEMREIFKDKADLRAALESYFHIYDDFAEMTEEEFEKGFSEFAD